MSEMKTFEECMKESFREIGVAPQVNTPAWRACKYVWDTAFEAGQRSRDEEVEEQISGGDMCKHGNSFVTFLETYNKGAESAVSAGYPALSDVMDTIRILRLGHQMYEIADVSEDYSRAHVTFHGAMQKLFKQLQQYDKGDKG